MIAIEHASRLVPGDAHRHALRHPGPRHQVPHATPAQVLNQPSLKTTPDLVLPRIRRMGLRSPRSPTRGRLASTITRKKEASHGRSDQPPKFYKNPTLPSSCPSSSQDPANSIMATLGKGVLFIVLYGLSWLSMFIVIGFITTPILWIWGMVDVNNGAKKMHEEIARS